jgi:hypothetical protein
MAEWHRGRGFFAYANLDLAAAQTCSAASRSEMQDATDGICDTDAACEWAASVLVGQANSDMAAAAASGVILQRWRWRR